MTMGDQLKPLSRADVLDLYKLYNTLIKEELSFFFQSFHFYIGLLSAILAGALTGVFNIGSRDTHGLLLLIGPVVILVLSRIGYNNALAFYRRFTETWVAKLNLESMLNLPQSNPVEPGLRQPLFASHKGGFIPQIEWRTLREVFEAAEKEKWSAEQLTSELVKIGTTLSDAKWTFILFSVAGAVFAIITVAIVVG